MAIRESSPDNKYLSSYLVLYFEDEFLFHSPSNRVDSVTLRSRPLRYSNWTAKVWRPTLRKLRLPPVGVHVLRHSAAARMISAGADALTVKKVLGHGSVAFTLTTYGHLFDHDLDDLAALLDAPADSSRIRKIGDGA